MNAIQTGFKNFFFNPIFVEDRRECNASIAAFRALEHMCDLIIFSSVFWKERKITVLFDNYVRQEIIKPFKEIEYSPRPQLLIEVFGVALSILFYLPACLIKAIIYSANKEYINLRAKRIFELQNYTPMTLLSFNQNFAISPINQSDSLLLTQLPPEILLTILTFLNNKTDLLHFSQASMGTYQLVQSFTKSIDYSNFLIDLFGRVQAMDIPPLALFHDHKMALSQATNEDKEAVIGWFRDFINELPNSKDFFKIAPASSAFYIAFPKGGVLFFKIKENHLNSTGTFVILKYENEYFVEANISIMLLYVITFLKVINHKEKGRKTIDFLKRLFAKEPCGLIFLEYGVDSPDIIAPKEGPRLCPDNKTPVLELTPFIVE